MNKATSFSQTKLFWSLLILLFCSGIYVSYHYFSTVFPIININISMNRNEALEAAKKMASQFNWGPQGFQQAVLFDDDNETQNFIELEGGGKKVFAEVLEEKYISPYTWHVRHFKEGEINETRIAFTPEGKPYGFIENLSEDAAGAALSSEEALALAEKLAKKNWHTDFSLYTLVERSQEKKPSGRIDHTFTFEHKNKKIGEAPYRLKLVISGEQLTEYNLYLKIPESFKRNYEHMRSFNETITKAASILFIILYIFGGCFIGLFFLMRQHWLIWKLPLIWAGFISFLTFLNTINSLPFYWMSYDTKLTKFIFLTNTLLMMFINFIAHFGMFTLIFTAAEGLTRKAFPQHLQLWRLWSRNAASSWQVLGRTVGGYLILGFDFAFIIGFYHFAFRYLGWWSPSETLINPNILSYYIPWLASISQALQAGFFEECLFRAIPLACAALIGKKTGHKNIWLIIGMIIQALIFSAAHASYPTQPGYARLVELIIPSLMFGTLYLIYGLLPAIISHFVYDVVWMALPLFVATAPGILVDKILVILATFIPLLIVLNARFFTGSWKEISTQFYNYNWQPTKEEKKLYSKQESYKVILTKNRLYSIVCAGFLGCALWIFGTRFNHDTQTIALSKKDALSYAQNVLEGKNLTKNDWTSKALINSQMQDADRFVWQYAGKNLYHKINTSYINTPHWQVRFAQFNNPDSIERAEEYTIHLAPDKGIQSFEHKLPESRTGKTLSEQEARTIAHNTLKKAFDLEPKNLIEISAVSTKHPNRLDWLFTFKDPRYFTESNNITKQGQARITVEIAGDEVINYKQSIFIPEEWTKKDQQEQAILKIFTLLCTIFLLLFLTYGALKALLQWINHEFDKKTFFTFFILLIIKSLIQVINAWDSLSAQFKTSEPYFNQSFSLLSSLSMQILFKAGAYALFAGFIARAHFKHFAPLNTSIRLLIGTSIAALIAGFNALCLKFSPSLKPLWPDSIHAITTMPALSCILTTFTTFLTNTLFFYVIIWCIDYFNTETKKNHYIISSLCVLTGIALRGAMGVEHVMSWLICGIASGIMLYSLYIAILKYSRSIIPIVIGAFISFQALQEAIFNAYQGAFIANILSGLVVMAFATWWSNQLEKEK